ncbi:ADP-ribosylglycohydrolase family protein [Sulfitobacter sp. HNIBRBA3233]|uniref:ADP-ribosylglycohydrolase family protein n=1 Tax=Sulfitobacter marinivivus TaxID=3158558 RepID=UPI0032DF1852
MSATMIRDMLLGAFVADAAALGLHWIYDPDRIADVIRNNGGRPAFVPINPAHYEGVPAYFAHGDRDTGMLTQYGETLRLCLRTLIDADGFIDAATYRQAFAGHFGAGGRFSGYIDKPTRGALQRIAAQEDETGIDDDQLPALSTLPAIVGAYAGAEDFDDMRRAAMRVTNINPVAEAYSAAFADLLSQVIGGGDLQQALDSTAARADGSIRDALEHALYTDEPDSVVFAGDVGRACHLPMAGPVIFHILKRSDSYRTAIETNIRAGGDSAGRAIMLGAVLGCAHGAGTDKGIPLQWLLAVSDIARIEAECRALARQP